MPTLAMPN